MGLVLQKLLPSTKLQKPRKIRKCEKNRPNKRILFSKSSAYFRSHFLKPLLVLFSSCQYFLLFEGALCCVDGQGFCKLSGLP